MIALSADAAAPYATEQDEVAAEAEGCASVVETQAVVQAKATCTQEPALAAPSAASAASQVGTACSVSPAAEAVGRADIAVAWASGAGRQQAPHWAGKAAAVQAAPVAHVGPLKLIRRLSRPILAAVLVARTISTSIGWLRWLRPLNPRWRTRKRRRRRMRAALVLTVELLPILCGISLNHALRRHRRNSAHASPQPRPDAAEPANLPGRRL